MKILTNLFFFVLLFPFFLSPILAVESLQNVSIYVNNQVASSNNECNLDLKPNDVIKIIGSYQPNQVIEITAFNQTFKQQTNENGDLLLLFSIPFVDYGSYKIETKLEKDQNQILLCNVNISDKKEDNKVDNKTKNNNMKFLFYIIPIILGVVIIYTVTRFIIKRKK